MKINFKFADLYEILDDNWYLRDDSDYTEDKGDYTYNLWLYRVVIPELHIAFRSGDAYVRNYDVDDPDDPEAYEYISGATVIYKDDESDFNNYIYVFSDDEEMAIHDYCQSNGIKCEDISSLDCYIETEEHADEDGIFDLNDLYL